MTLITSSSMSGILVRAWLIMLALAFALTGCASTPELIGIDNPDVPAASVKEATRHKVFVATTRQRTDETGAFYSGQRAQELGFASVEVSIPPTHVTGKIERPKSLPPDPRTEFAVVDPTVFATDAAFVASVNAALRQWPRGKRDILLFVHGYNTTTSDAVLRLAQFVEDSGFEGVPVLFSWASAAQAPKYVYDMNSALIARGSIPRAVSLLRATNAENFDIFAHSMGTLLTMEGLLDQKQRGLLNRSGQVQHVVLASPDIDLDLFRSQLKQLEADFNIFVLLSADDKALRFSRLIAGGVPRVGAAATEDLAQLGVVVIDLTEIETEESLNHSKFANSPEVVRVIGKGLNQSGDFDEDNRGSRVENLVLGLPITILSQ